PLRCSKLIRAISGGAGLHAAGADAPLDVGVEELRPRRGADAQEHVDVGVAELRVGEHRFRRAVGEVAALALRLQDDEAAAARGQRRAVRPRDLGPRRAPDDVLALAPERGLRLQRAQRLVALVVHREAHHGSDELALALGLVDGPVRLGAGDVHRRTWIRRAARGRQRGEDEDADSGNPHACPTSFYAPSGIAMRKRAPGPSGRSSSVPPWSSTKRRATASPRPVPLFFPRVTNGSKSRSRISGGTPGPSSATVRTRRGAPSSPSGAASSA